MASDLFKGQRFNLGKLVATPGALKALGGNGDVGWGLLQRHASGDWGDLDAHDRVANDDAVKCGERILSAYRLHDGTRIWCVTEWDRSVTTLLLPNEY